MRKLATAAFAFAGGTFAARYFLPEKWLLVLAAALFLLGFAALALKSDKRLRMQLICFSACIALAWFFLYGQVFMASARLLAGTSAETTVTAVDFPAKTSTGMSVNVSVSAKGHKAVKAVLYDKSGAIASVEPGDRLRGSFRFYAEDDRTDYYNASGVFLRAAAESELRVEIVHSNALRYLPVKAAHAARQMIDRLYPASSAPFLRALLTGDKAELKGDNELINALSVTGVSHIVAISGMHLSFIVSLVMLIGGRKQRRALICVPFILAFMLFTGNSPSVVRAGVMQMLFIAAPMLRREYDAWTGLGFSLLLLLIFNPYSIANAGLQLSFASVAGITVISPRINFALFSRANRVSLLSKPIIRNVTSFVIATTASTFGALIFTVPLTALLFGSVSVVSPLTNLLVLWAVSAAFTLGALSVAAGFLFVPLGAALAWLCRWFVLYISAVVRMLARLPFAAVYTENAYMRLWILYVLVLAVLMLMSRNLRFRALIMAAAAAFSFALSIIFTLYGSGQVEITVIDAGQGQCIAVRSENRTALIDCGGNVYSGAGNAAAEFLLSEGETRVDTVVLTHFHDDHTNGLPDLFSRVDTETLFAPTLLADSGEDVVFLAESCGVRTHRVTEAESISVGSARLYLYPPADDSGGTEECMAVMIVCSDFEMLITGDMTKKLEEKLAEQYGITGADVLVAGHHGSKNALSEKLLYAAAPEAVIISVGRNSYGHPAAETLEKLALAGCKTYRTDETGNITIRID